METGSNQTSLEWTQKPTEVRWVLGAAESLLGKGPQPGVGLGALLPPCGKPMFLLCYVLRCSVTVPLPMILRTPPQVTVAFPGLFMGVWKLISSLHMTCHRCQLRGHRP